MHFIFSVYCVGAYFPHYLLCLLAIKKLVQTIFWKMSWFSIWHNLDLSLSLTVFSACISRWTINRLWLTLLVTRQNKSLPERKTTSHLKLFKVERGVRGALMLQNRTELRINTAQNTEIKIHAYAKRQTWICITWPSFSIIFFTPVLTIGIARGCFYLLIFYSKDFSTWVWRLPFAVNVNINLSLIT